ncbi:cmdD [Symbiodinium natans]|uniref:CmdD protein n=1 Tax=Symbiodinium natans TaxID=878477 RepID=A0A812JH03_9DINO|nr:cmdD [Symbiodinium natans]
MDVNQVDYCNETPIFYAVQNNKLETAATVVYLLKCGASLGINNSSLESPESLASVEMARDLRARIEEWGEPSQPTTPSKKRKRREEDEPSAAEGPRAFENWVAKRARLPKSHKSNAKKEKPKPQAPEVVAENATHQIELIREEFLEQVRELEKGLVTDQVGLFKTQLFVRACRSADYCAALGAYATDSDFFKQYSNIIERRGTFGSLVLVAVDKSSGRVVGFCHADAGNNELLIGHLKVHSEHQQKGVGKLLMAAAETKALSSGWAFESVAVRVLHVNSRAQQIFFRMGFDIRDEPAPETTISLLSMCIKMVRRAQHVPEATMKSVAEFQEGKLPDSQTGPAKRLRLAGASTANPSLKRQGPLLRLVFFHGKVESKTRHAVALTVHNAVCDGWSMNMLLQDILALAVGGSVPERPAPSVNARVGNEAEEAKRWRQAMEGFRCPPELEATTPETVGPRRLKMTWGRLSEAAAAMRLMPSALLLASWTLVYARASRRYDLAMGTVLSGREAVGEDALGCALSLLPLRLRLTDEWQTVQSFAAEVQRGLLGLIASPLEASLSQIRGWSGLPNGRPLFDCAWLFDNAPALPSNLLEKTGLELISEVEIPALGEVAETPELRLARRGDRIIAALSGKLPGAAAAF